ncbi:hypothetical protein [Taibaiella koreensis]|uniref:hypothetical protein n=1 Tax=Taibaiella koreensis TaxID=1268548 RepID=UPI000E59D27B|nr:hypothetical protein [Taibaiella koreensis]
MTNYIYDGSLAENISFSTMISAAQSKHGGPQPICKQKITKMIPQEEGIAIKLDGSDTRYVAVPLISCAAVIFASAQSDTAYLYHALSGTVPQQIFNTAMAALGKVALQSVFVIYTFTNPSDKNYIADAGALALYGIPDKNIIFAPSLLGSTFGINAQTIVG